MTALVLTEARKLPFDVRESADDIAEAAMQAAFTKIAEKLEELGYPVTGDLTPEEELSLETAFRRMVRAMALNNIEIGELNV